MLSCLPHRVSAAFLARSVLTLLLLVAVSFLSLRYELNNSSPLLSNSRIDFYTIDKLCEYLEVRVGYIFEYVTAVEAEGIKK